MVHYFHRIFQFTLSEYKTSVPKTSDASALKMNYVSPVLFEFFFFFKVKMIHVNSCTPEHHLFISCNVHGVQPQRSKMANSNLLQ